VFLPDGPLFRLPFGSLPLGDDRGVLDDDFVTSVAPSLSMLKETATRGSAPGPALLVGYGATREAGRFPALPLVAQELNHVAEAYPHHARLEGAAATGGAVLAAMPRATVIHFAGHAVANEMHPSESRLLVAPSGDRGELRTEEIAGVRLQPGTVVVLSACDTARGRIYRGEGAMTLARPFLAAGASAVVATLWRVRDDALFGVLAQFHRELASGLDAPQAMARARQSAAIVHHPDERSLVVIGMGGVR
jgi:CHAT domain-containing protein